MHKIYEAAIFSLKEWKIKRWCEKNAHTDNSVWKIFKRVRAFEAGCGDFIRCFWRVCELNAKWAAHSITFHSLPFSVNCVEHWGEKEKKLTRTAKSTVKIASHTTATSVESQGRKQPELVYCFEFHSVAHFWLDSLCMHIFALEIKIFLFSNSHIHGSSWPSAAGTLVRNWNA